MSDHLPECVHPQRDYPCAWCQEIDCECPCICDRLRACEQRVLLSKPNIELSAVYGYEAGRLDGLRAARDAVADVVYVRPAYYGKGVLIRGCEPDMVRQDALAAIDALRGDA